MTREEAIKCLKVLGGTTLLDEYDDPIDFDPYEEALDMAIEALQREDAEANGYCHRIKPKGGETE